MLLGCHVRSPACGAQITFLQYFLDASDFVYNCCLVDTEWNTHFDDIINISSVKWDVTMRCLLSNISSSTISLFHPLPVSLFSLTLSLFPIGVQTLPNLASPPLTVSMETYSLVVGYRKSVCMCVRDSHYFGFSWLSAWLRLRQTVTHTLSHINSVNAGWRKALFVINREMAYFDEMRLVNRCHQTGENTVWSSFVRL